jgi:hypothetical protein
MYKKVLTYMTETGVQQEGDKNKNGRLQKDSMSELAITIGSRARLKGSYRLTQVHAHIGVC